MISRLFLLLGSFALLPTIATAAEPSKGTVITVASIGGWVIFSSAGMAMRRKRDERGQAVDANLDKQPRKG